MKYIIFCTLVIAVGLQACNGQTSQGKKEVYNKEFNWRISIPEKFESVSPEQWAKMQNRGAEAIEKTYDAKVENKTKTIFVFQADQFNYFESNYQPYDPAEDGEYTESFKMVNDMLYGTFEAQMPGVKLDSSYSQEIIAGLKFYKFKVDITLPNNKVLKCLMYSRLFGKREFTVNMMTMNPAYEKSLLEAWRNSTFGNK